MPLAWREQDDPDVSVAAAEDRVGPGRGATAGGLISGGLGRPHRPHRRLDRLRGRFVQGEVDVIAVTGFEAVPVRDERRPRRLRCGQRERHPARRQQRLAPR